MLKHKCKFVNDWESAKFNERWLKHYRWDLEVALDRQKGTMVHPGSEYREVNIVEELWRRHELWPKMRRILEEGVDYPLEEISEEERKNDLM